MGLFSKRPKSAFQSEQFNTVQDRVWNGREMPRTTRQQFATKRAKDSYEASLGYRPDRSPTRPGAGPPRPGAMGGRTFGGV